MNYNDNNYILSGWFHIESRTSHKLITRLPLAAMSQLRTTEEYFLIVGRRLRLRHRRPGMNIRTRISQLSEAKTRTWTIRNKVMMMATTIPALV